MSPNYHALAFWFASLTFTGNKSLSKLVEEKLGPWRKTQRQGSPTQGESLAKLSSLLTPRESLHLSHEHSSSLERFFSLTLHGLLARQRGALEHRASRTPTSLSLKLPPALPSHCSSIPQRRSHSARSRVLATQSDKRHGVEAKGSRGDAHKSSSIYIKI